MTHMHDAGNIDEERVQQISAPSEGLAQFLNSIPHQAPNTRLASLEDGKGESQPIHKTKQTSSVKNEIDHLPYNLQTLTELKEIEKEFDSTENKVAAVEKLDPKYKSVIQESDADVKAAIAKMIEVSGGSKNVSKLEALLSAEIN